MFERCHNCGQRVFKGVRDNFGIFCSMVCRNNVAHPGFCNACVAATTPTSAGSNVSVNGIGAVFYSASDFCKTCGSAIRSQWLCVFFIPVFRLGRFRVKYVAPNRYLSRKLAGKPKEPPSLAAHEPRPQNTKTHRTAVVFLACAIAFCIIVILFFRPWEQRQVSRPETHSPSNPFAELIQPLTLPELIKLIRPSVVQILGYKNGQLLQTGSGFFVGRSGDIATNFHVVDGIDKAIVKLSNGAAYEVVDVLTYSQGADIAILETFATDPKPLPLSTNLPEVGERIYVLGNPGTFEGSLSDGLVSAKRRDDYGALVQISAPISHGSSGSPVFNKWGRCRGYCQHCVRTWTKLKFRTQCGHDSSYAG
jgi:hypothetical protein